MSKNDNGGPLVCAACQKPIQAGEHFVEVKYKNLVALKTKTKSVPENGTTVMHKMCFQMATRSPDIDLRAVAEMAENVRD